MNVFINLISRIIQLLIIVIIIRTFLTYFLDPFHPVRRFFDRLVEPMLMPIRRLMPPVGMVDFSPLILIIVLQVVNIIIRNILISFS
jgi:YggT family protein